MISKSELDAIKKRVDSWPDYKKANYNAIFGEVFAITIKNVDFLSSQMYNNIGDSKSKVR